MTLRATSLQENLLPAKGQKVHGETVSSDEGHSKPFALTFGLVLLCLYLKSIQQAPLFFFLFPTNVLLFYVFCMKQELN